MYPSLAISNFFVKDSIATGKLLTPMKLVKLTYIAHGYYLAFNNGQPLLNEAIQAWKYGPVVPPVYEQYKGFGRQFITKILMPVRIGFTGKESKYSLPANVEQFLKNVSKAYEHHTGLDLSTLTHQSGTPWDIVTSDYEGSLPRNLIIPNDRIESHYKEIINE